MRQTGTLGDMDMNHHQHRFWIAVLLTSVCAFGAAHSQEVAVEQSCPFTDIYSTGKARSIVNDLLAHAIRYPTPSIYLQTSRLVSQRELPRLLVLLGNAGSLSMALE